MNSTGFSKGFNYSFHLLLMGYQMVLGQMYGTVNLPGSLADPGVQIQRAAASTPTLDQWCMEPVVPENSDLFFPSNLREISGKSPEISSVQYC